MALISQYRREHLGRDRAQIKPKRALTRVALLVFEKSAVPITGWKVRIDIYCLSDKDMVLHTTDSFAWNIQCTPLIHIYLVAQTNAMNLLVADRHGNISVTHLFP